MPQQPSETSVSTLVSKLSVGESVTFKNKKRESVAVMVSNLKRADEHKLKTFKLKDEKGKVTVTRNS